MKLKIVSIFLILSSIHIISANEKMTLTLDDTIKLAKENNLSLKIQKNSLEDAEYKNNYSWNSISPSINGSVNFNDDFENNKKSLGISGGVKLNLSTNIISTVEGAKLNLENQELTYSQAERQIELNVRKAFYSLIYQKDYLSLKERSLETARTNYVQNQEKFKNGKISELDVMTSRVNYEQQKPDVEAAKIELESSMDSFKQLIGLSLDTEIELKGNLDKFLELKTYGNLSADEERYSNTKNPDTEMAEKAVKIAENNLRGQRFSAYGPSISGSYNFGKTLNPDNSDWSTTNSLTVGVTIPLDGYLPWSANGVSINSQKINLKTAELKLKDTVTSVSVKSKNLLNKISQGISQISSLKETAELAQKTYEMSKTAWNYGKIDFLALQNSSDSVLTAEVNLKKQAKTLVETILDYEYLMGLEFENIK